MMEYWNVGPPWRDSVLIASSGIKAWIIAKKWTLYKSGLGQGILGLKSEKRSILQKNVASSFMLMPARHPFSAFAPQNTLILRENQYNYIRFESLNPPFQYSKTHDSIIPLFHHSNCGAKLSSASAKLMPIQPTKPNTIIPTLLTSFCRLSS